MAQQSPDTVLDPVSYVEKFVPRFNGIANPFTSLTMNLSGLSVVLEELVIKSCRLSRMPSLGIRSDNFRVRLDLALGILSTREKVTQWDAGRRRLASLAFLFFFDFFRFFCPAVAQRPR